MQKPAIMQTGMPVMLTFHITEEGELIDLGAAQRTLHLVTANEDYRDLTHTLGLMRMMDGAYASPPLIFTQPGRHRVWIEIDDERKENPHGTSVDLIAYEDIMVAGPAAQPEIPLETDREVSLDGFTLRLDDTAETAGRETVLRFTITDAAGAPVPMPPHDPVLFALTNSDLSFFDHGHMSTDENGTAATYALRFPAAGNYALLAQTLVPSNGGWRMIEVHFLISVQP